LPFPSANLSLAVRNGHRCSTCKYTGAWKHGRILIFIFILFSRLEGMLEKSQIGCARLDGTMSREDRTEAMDRLKNDRKCEVLLVSLRAGGVGLNLVAASRCYLVDPYW
jgi:hypothetical protein